MSENKSQTPAQNTPDNEKKKVTLFALIVVLVVAVIVMVVLFARSNNLSSQLDQVNGELTARNTELQQTISEKETAQQELTTAQNDLREAQLVLEESTAKVAALEEQILVLNDENEANKIQVATLTAELDTAKANQAAAQGYLDEVSAQMTLLMENLGLAQDALNGEAATATDMNEAELPLPEVTAEPEATEEPAVTEEPAATEEPEATEEPAAKEEPEVTEEPAATEEPEVTEEPAATTEPEATEEPAVTDEPEVEAEYFAAPVALNDDALINTLLHVDADKTVLELELTLEGEYEGLTQEMLNDYAAQFVGKTLPLVLRENADETNTEAQIVDAMETLPEISAQIVDTLNSEVEEPAATEEPMAEMEAFSSNVALDDANLISIVLTVDASKNVQEVTLTLEGEYEGLTQEMLNDYAAQFAGKTLPLVLRADADETVAEAQIVDAMETLPEISYQIVDELNKLIAE